jgi:hypothetical protein
MYFTGRTNIDGGITMTDPMAELFNEFLNMYNSQLETCNGILAAHNQTFGNLIERVRVLEERCQNTQ